MEAEIKKKAELWLAGNYDADTKAKVEYLLKHDEKELIESFYKDLEFGTGGMRGLMGVGTNKINIYTIGAATQGLSNYVKASFSDLPQISVAVAHDCRNNSRLFAETCANIFSASGFKVYLFDSQAEPIKSFPINGASDIDLGNTNKSKTIELVVKENRNTVVVYKL